jgi:putative CocE/NonD family hydrolase
MVDNEPSFDRRGYLTLLSLAVAGGVAGCGQSGQDTTTAAPTTTPPTETETIAPTTTESTTTTAEDGQPYEVRSDVMVEMRDGVSLATDVFLPSEGDGPYPTLVNRTPYDKTSREPVGGTATATEAGYAVVQQDVRGRYASEGEWTPFFDEGQDGYDTVEWAAEQDWSTGDVGVYGNSYMGITTWQAVLADPPSLQAAAPFITPTNYFDHSQYYEGAGEFGLSLFFNTFTSISTVSRLDASDQQKQQLRGELQQQLVNFQQQARQLPTEDIEAFDDGVAPFWENGWDHDTYDDYWKQFDVLQAIENVETPVIHVGGWYDIFLRGHTDLFQAVEDRGTETVRSNQHMTIGPYAHLTFGTANSVGSRSFPDEVALDLGSDYVVPWFDRWLKGDSDGLGRDPVRYYQMGTNEWRTADTWPPAGGTDTDFYFDSGGNANTRSGDGTLSRETPATDSPVDTYEYDPLDPVPTTGGPLLMGRTEPAGVFDQADVESRDDVLVYTSEPLSEPVEVAGPVEATLFAATTGTDTDFVVRLVDVGPDGFAANITDGVARAKYRNSLETKEPLTPEEVYELDVELRPTAHTFQADHRIRVQVTSSNFPRIDRNPNQAMRVSEATEADMQTATQTIHHTESRPSRITLPVMGN